MGKRYEVSWEGHFSLNKLYEGGHWTRRNGLKQKWKGVYMALISEAKIPRLSRYTLEIRYNSRLDPSNVTGMLKVFEDTLTEMGVIPDDSKKFCRGIGIVPDEGLKSGVYVAVITEVKDC